MEDITLLVYAALGFATLIMAVLAVALMMLGKLIDATPDGLERRGELIRDEISKNSFLAPKNISKVYALAFSILFIIGCVIFLLAGGSKVIMIIGGVIVFSALLFSTTVALIELLIYQTMQKNLKELKGSAVV